MAGGVFPPPQVSRQLSRWSCGAARARGGDRRQLPDVARRSSSSRLELETGDGDPDDRSVVSVLCNSGVVGSRRIDKTKILVNIYFAEVW